LLPQSRCYCFHKDFFDSSISDTKVCPSSYLIFRRDGSRHGGGVLICIRDSLSNQCDELLWLEICTYAGAVLFGVFYHPPNHGVYNLSALNNCLLSVSQYPIILCGDFNMPSINWSLTFPLYRHCLLVYCVI